MEFYQLEYFRILCKCGSYTAASQELHVSQPAISMAVKKLEEECGGDIIDHNLKSFVLTAKGEALRSWAVIIHNDMERMQEDIGSFSARQREIIRLAFPMPLCPELMTDVIPAFCQHHSNVAMYTIQAGHTAIASNLMKGQTDLGILCQDMVTASLESVFYKDVEYVACLAPNHPLHQYEVLRPDLLSGETLIIPKVENSISKAIKEYFHPPLKKPALRFENVYPEDIGQLARQGKGIAFVPRSEQGEDCIPLSPPLYSRLVIAWRKGETLTRKKQELVDYILRSV